MFINLGPVFFGQFLLGVSHAIKIKEFNVIMLSATNNN
jgi:hypothetical protein